MADAQTHAFLPNAGVSMKQFNEGLVAACEEADVTKIEAAVVDGALVITLLTGVVEATEEDVEEAKDEDGKAPFAEGDEIPEGDRLMVKATKLSFQTAEDVVKIVGGNGKKGNLDLIYDQADGMIVEHRIVTGRALCAVQHPDDAFAKKKLEGSRAVYVEKDVSYAVVVWLADGEADDASEGGDKGDEVAATLRRPVGSARSAADILRGSED